MNIDRYSLQWRENIERDLKPESLDAKLYWRAVMTALQHASRSLYPDQTPTSDGSEP